jgi:hypothetical protein
MPATMSNFAKPAFRHDVSSDVLWPARWENFFLARNSSFAFSERSDYPRSVFDTRALPERPVFPVNIRGVFEMRNLKSLFVVGLLLGLFGGTAEAAPPVKPVKPGVKRVVRKHHHHHHSLSRYHHHIRAAIHRLYHARHALYLVHSNVGGIRPRAIAHINQSIGELHALLRIR